MDLQTQLEPRLLLQKAPPAIAHHFENLIKCKSADLNAINTHLVSQVHDESIPALVYEIWFHLAIKHIPKLLHAGLTDRISRGVRKASLHALRRKFHCRNWKETWDLLGGAAGIKALIDSLPLSDVKWLALDITEIKFQGPREVTAACAEELLRLVAESDRATGRLISPTLAPLIHLCSESYVLRYLKAQGPRGDLRLKEIGSLHLNLLRRIVVGTVEVSEDLRARVFDFLRESLVRSQEEYVPVYLPSDMPADIHPGMAFCLDLVHALSADAGFRRRISSRTVLDLLHATLKLAAKNGFSLDIVLKLVKHILPTYLHHSDHHYMVPRLPSEILKWWSIARTGECKHTAGFWLRSLFSHHDAKCFSLHLGLLEDLLLQTLRQQVDRKFNVRKNPREFHSNLRKHLYDIAHGEKMIFIKLLCRLPSIDVDLDTWPPSERESQLFAHWEEATLRTLPTSDAKGLFGRMLEIHGCEEFLPDPENLSPSEQMTWTAQCLLKIDWELDEDTTAQLPVTRKVLAESKRRATRERDPQGRLTWATASLQFAIASKSVDVFHETVEWSRRFLRDPFVFPGLLHIIFSNRTASILSCTQGPKRPTTLPDLKAVVEKSHEVLRSYLDIAHLILREPHYKKNLTSGIPNLLSGIITRRIEGFESSPGTESERLDTLLYPLLPIIHDFERLANEDADKFSWSGFSGAVSQIDCLDDDSKPVLSFLDRMAYERNQFWVEKRRDDNPEMDLPLGFPPGLPLQDLLPGLELTNLAHRYPEDMPYVAGRLADLLMPSTSVMLSVVPASVARKTYPIDDLSYAIRAVIEDPSEAVKEKEFLQIWKTFSDALHPYPDQLEIFKNWLVNLARQERLWNAVKVIQPPLPEEKSSVSTYFEQCFDVDHVVEWNPRPAPAPMDSANTETEPEERKVERTVLICRMDADPIIRTKIRPKPEENPLSIWYRTHSSLAPSEREAVALSALLYIDTLNQQTKRILRRPWPENVSSPRYPAIFLADEFLTAVATRGNEAIEAATDALKECVKVVPAQLLHDVVVSLLVTLAENADKKQPSYSTILSATMRLIKLLQDTDQPQLATDSVLQILTSFPDASSYHRQMRLLTLARRLLPQDAARMFNTFVDFVCNTGKSEPAPTKAQPYVKITTIKMLAQLLADATFIDISTCLRTLQNIFDSTSHIDVRSEVVITVLRLFDRVADFTSVFTAMASMASAASGPSEREAMSETDWLAAEKRERPLPEVAPVSDRPLFQFFLETAFHYVPEQHRREYLHRVLLPLLEESTRQHTRWIRCFLSQVQLTPDEDNAITSLGKAWAFDPSAIHTFFRTWRLYLPKSYLLQHRGWALAYLHCPHVQKIDDKLSAINKKWRGSTAGKHWLMLRSHLHSWKPFAAIDDSIIAGLQTQVEGGITLSDLVDEYISRAGILSRHPVRFDHQLGHLAVSVNTSLESLAILKKQMRSVSNRGRYDLLQAMMERIVADIESLRTAQWKDDPSRSPAVLPSRLEIDILLLPLPGNNPRTKDPAMEFGRRLLDLVKKVADDPLLLVEFETVKAQVKDVKEKDLASFALLFGSDGEEDYETLYGRLKIDIARCALQRIKSEDLRQDNELKRMIRRWKTSSDEWVRQVGWSFDGRFR